MKSEPLQLPPTPTGASEDLATGRQALIDTWNTWAKAFSSESLESMKQLKDELKHMQQAWKPLPLPKQKLDTLETDYSNLLTFF